MDSSFSNNMKHQPIAHTRARDVRVKVREESGIETEKRLRKRSLQVVSQTGKCGDQKTFPLAG